MSEKVLASRLGCSVHVSVLRRKLERLFRASDGNAPALEDWLVDVANERGTRIVTRVAVAAGCVDPGSPVPIERLSNEELVVGILVLQNPVGDEPGIVPVGLREASAAD